MTAPTEITIQLDAKTKVVRSGSRWAVLKRLPDGSYDLFEAWDGSRRSLLQWAERNGVYLTRQAEAVLQTLPEGTGFKDRT